MDDLDIKLTPREVFERGERRLKERQPSDRIAVEFTRLRNDLDLAIASKEFVVAENYRLRRIIEAQEFLINRSKPKGENCKCEKSSSTP